MPERINYEELDDRALQVIMARSVNQIAENLAEINERCHVHNGQIAELMEAKKQQRFDLERVMATQVSLDNKIHRLWLIVITTAVGSAAGGTIIGRLLNSIIPI